VPRCRLPLPEEQGKGLSEHELGLKRGRYNKEMARKKARNEEKKRREEKGETVSPDTSDMPPFSQFERSSSDSSQGSVVGPSGADSGGGDLDDDGGDGPSGAEAAQLDEDVDAREPVEPSGAASSASDPDPKGKRAREEVPTPEGEPSDKRARTDEPAQASTTGVPAEGGEDSSSRFVGSL
jgi:hypothetical protein